MPNTLGIPEEEYRQNLRTEYQVCQQYISSNSTGYWTFASIFLGLSTTALSFIVPNIFSIQAIGFKATVTIIAIGMFIIYCSLNKLLKRANKQNKIVFHRMRDIEKETGMLFQTIMKLKLGHTSGFNYWVIIIYTLSTFWLTILVLTWAIW
jgi:hypothetical protein